MEIRIVFTDGTQKKFENINGFNLFDGKYEIMHRQGIRYITEKIEQNSVKVFMISE